MTYEEFADTFDFFKSDDGIIHGTEEERAELIRLLEEKIKSKDDVEKLKYVINYYGYHGAPQKHTWLIST